MNDLIIIGGGAAGIFAAITAKIAHPRLSVILIEKTNVLLAKVRISGGGRCNVTHHCFDPMQLVQNYPRGGKELIGPFHRFQPRDTIEWFEARGVKIKAEKDGRMFPITNRSETIVDCLLSEAKQLGVEIRTMRRIQTIEPRFLIKLQNGETLRCKRLLLATGSNPEGLSWAQTFGHTIQKPVPSLFTFNVPTSPLKNLSGISVNPAKLQFEGAPFSQTGPLLITHFGFSGPAVLKLSAWAARFLAEKNYRANLSINWLPSYSKEEILKQLKIPSNPFKFSKNLWKVFSSEKFLAQKLQADCYAVDGKTTHKEEFVTCGGVTLKEVDFKTMESKLCPGLFFAGEILDIDGVTGGFNFQNAWTTGFIAGTSQTE